MATVIKKSFGFLKDQSFRWSMFLPWRGKTRYGASNVWLTELSSFLVLTQPLLGFILRMGSFCNRISRGRVAKGGEGDEL